MKTSKRIALASLVALFLIINACKKEDKENIIITGTVINPQNGSPISGAKVYLDGKILNGGVYNDNYSEIANATTDASGTFEIKTPYQVVSSYKIRAFKNNYFDYSKIIASESIEKGSTYSTTLSILPVSWVKLNINNVLNYSEDEIQYKYSGTPLSCFDCCSNQFLIGTGSYHTTYKCKVVGNQYNKFYWTVRRNGLTNPFTDSIYCAAFDTTVLNINY